MGLSFYGRFGACPKLGSISCPAPLGTARSFTAPWPEKGGSRLAKEVPGLQAVIAGSHDYSGPKVPRSGTQKVSGRTGESLKAEIPAGL